MSDNSCNGYMLSQCCGSTLKWGVICTNCLEHADTMCVNCDEIDKEECENNPDKKE
jgi:hypothetical protein